MTISGSFGGFPLENYFLIRNTRPPDAKRIANGPDISAAATLAGKARALYEPINQPNLFIYDTGNSFANCAKKFVESKIHHYF